MNSKFKNIVKNFSYSFSANIVSLLISVLTIAIIPKLVGVTEYGYWQLYTFYLSYIVFFRFGHADGIYLKYGGMEYKNLDRKVFATQFWLLVGAEIIISLMILIYGLLFIENTDRLFIIVLISLNVILVIPKTLLQIVLQATNRITDYASSIMIERVLYGVLLISSVALGVRDYRILIILDLIAKIVSLVFTVGYCKQIIFSKLVGLKIGVVEAWDNMKIGMNLMFSNIASLSIIGVIRLGIERKWDIATFGKISLTLSISNMLMLFINAIGVVFYPILKNTSFDKLPQIYIKMRNILILSFFGMLIFYYPASTVFELWLPNYAESLKYMALLFPICIFESKMSMLIVPYYNSLRKEKLMLRINLVTLVLSLLTTFIVIFILHNLTFAVISITILLALRCEISEILLSKILNINLLTDIFMELVMTGVFVTCAWFASTYIGILIYCFAYIVLLYFKRLDISEFIMLFGYIVKRKPE